jgi:hypothetical protein
MLVRVMCKKTEVCMLLRFVYKKTEVCMVTEKTTKKTEVWMVLYFLLYIYNYVCKVKLVYGCRM